MKAFAMTFAYNESFYLPRWVAYYGAQLGLENLFVLDHGSSDLSTQGLGPVNIIKVPRSPYDEVKRITFASQMHSALLNYYDCGYVMDVDEFIVAEPAKYKNLKDFAERTTATALACIGLELFHIRALEPAFQDYLPILSQRRHVVFSSWMCKRSFASKSVRFGGGFHTSDQPVKFDPDLVLVHLKNFDFQYRLMRQQITAGWDYAGNFGDHAKQSAQYVDGLFTGIDLMVPAGKLRDDLDFSLETNACVEKTVVNPSGEYDFNLDGGFQGEHLHLLPEHFQGLF